MISDSEIKEIKLFKEKNDCCACGACLNICPKQAISMQKDEYGFLYPQIDKGKCIKCGLCLKTCAFQNSELKNIPIKTYAAQSDNTDLKESASGGIFASIATNVLREGGVVYGAAMEMENDKLIVRHIAVENDADLIKLQGSKYVQSSTEKIYQDVKKKLNDNRLVLFSGTPCQVDGLNSYLGKTYDNLITIDIICHGVPNNQMFQDYIALLEEKYKDKIIKAGYIDDEDLPALYSGAEFFIYTSEYEGFGLPPLEAMKCGMTVITSNNSSLPEVVGDAAIKIDFDSIEQHINAYEKLYFNNDLRTFYQQKAIQQAAKFSWDKTVNIMVKTIKNIIN